MEDDECVSTSVRSPGWLLQFQLRVHEVKQADDAVQI